MDCSRSRTGQLGSGSLGTGLEEPRPILQKWEDLEKVPILKWECHDVMTDGPPKRAPPPPPSPLKSGSPGVIKFLRLPSPVPTQKMGKWAEEAKA